MDANHSHMQSNPIPEIYLKKDESAPINSGRTTSRFQTQETNDSQLLPPSFIMTTQLNEPMQ